ncbi:MAG: signal peptidase II [Sphingomonadaceae bacterium]|nr:signal peptidase II [Sphingomonadaceae bacterium]
MVTTARNCGLMLAAAVFIVDQVMKYLVTGPIGLVVEGQSIELLPIFNLTLVHNYGVSLGMLTAESNAMRWGLVAMTGAISLFVGVWLWREANRVDVLALGMVLGGAVGNLLDRVRFGHVVDYADLHFGEFRPFLVFNVADAAITIGVLILLARALLVRDRKPEAENENA